MRRRCFFCCRRIERQIAPDVANPFSRSPRKEGKITPYSFLSRGGPPLCFPIRHSSLGFIQLYTNLTITFEFALGGEKRKDERETGRSHLPTSTKNDDHLPQTLTPARLSLLIFFPSLTSTLEIKAKQYRESSRSRIIEKRRFHSQKKARSQMDCIEKAFEAKQSFALSFLLSLSLFLVEFLRRPRGPGRKYNGGSRA